MQKPAIVISGKNGQLGNELQDACNMFPQFQYYFFSREELDIANVEALEEVFKKCNPAYFINTAAYTAVDKSETDQENAYLVNAVAVDLIAKACKRFNTRLIHVSTDYVFDGKVNKPYKEDDAANPINYYGYTKWMGEKFALTNHDQTIVIRTSWVYSVFGNNFVKTMLRLMKERPSINVVNDQYGSPTYAKDLAEAILKICNDTQNGVVNFQQGIYHFSNAGDITWFDFASAIQEIKKLNCSVHPIPTELYPTPAKRPAWTVMSKEKIRSAFHVEIKDWRESLQACLARL